MNNIKRPKVGIVVLNYNGMTKFEKVFKKCVDSIVKTSYDNLKICFVDNGSSDNSVEYLKSINDKRVFILELKNNFGWSGGNNRGAIFCKDCKYIAFVNNDIEIIDPHWLNNLVSILETNPNIGVIQPLIYNKDGSISLGFSIGRLGFPKIRKYGDIYRPLFYVSGAALITRAELFFRIGGFDESLFLLHDDLDYSWRILLAGYKPAVSYSSKVFHYGGKTFGTTSHTKARQIYYMIRNNIWLLYKNYPIRLFLQYLFLWLYAIIISFLSKAIIYRETLNIKNIVLGLIHGILFMNRNSNAKSLKTRNYDIIFERMDKRIDVDLLAPWIKRVFKIKL